MDALDAARAARHAINTIAERRFYPGPPETAALFERYRSHTYYVGRGSALGGGPRVAHAAFGLISSGRVAYAYRRVGEQQRLDEFAVDYAAACDALGARLFSDLPERAALAGLLTEMIDRADLAGAPLAAAWWESASYADPGSVIERAATVLREQRGAMHLAALTACGLFGAEALLVHALWRETDPARSLRFFGWREADVDGAWERLEASGRVEQGALTAAAREERETVEQTTGALAARCWESLAPDRRQGLIELLEQAASRVDPVAD